MWDVPAMPNLSPWFMKVKACIESVEFVYKIQRLTNTAEHARCHLLLRRHRFRQSLRPCLLPTYLPQSFFSHRRLVHRLHRGWVQHRQCAGQRLCLHAHCKVLGYTDYTRKMHEQRRVLLCQRRAGNFHRFRNRAGAHTLAATAADALATEGGHWRDSGHGVLVSSQPPIRTHIPAYIQSSPETNDTSVGIVSCIRLSTLYVLMNSPDLTWATTDALMWCAIELNLGIFGGCVTAMRPFVRRYFPRLLGLSSMGDSYSRSRKYAHPLNSIPRSDHPNFTGTNNQYSTKLQGGVTSDGDSEEQILRDAAAPPAKGKNDNAGIVRTVEFDVENGSSRW